MGYEIGDVFTAGIGGGWGGSLVIKVCQRMEGLGGGILGVAVKIGFGGGMRKV